MEDRQSLSPNGAEFRAPLEDEEKDKDKKEKSGKKKTFLAWLKNNVFKSESDEDQAVFSDKEPGRVRTFVDSLKGWLNPIAGVEKHEVNEIPEADDMQSDDVSVRFPLFAELAPEPLSDKEEQHAVASNIVKEDTAETHYPESEGVTQDIDEAVHNQIAPNQVNIVKAAQDLEQSVGHDSEVAVEDNEMPTPNTSQEVVEQYDVDTRERIQDSDASMPKERETIIEDRSGGAALLAFVAAETLSRSRDAKIRKEAKNLKKQVSKLENEHHHQRYVQTEVKRATERNEEQISKLREKRTESIPKESATNNYETIPDRHREQSVEYPSENVEKQKQIILEQIEHAAERDVALEAQYERMHEAKDVPTASTPIGGAGISTTSSTGPTNGDDPANADFAARPEATKLQQNLSHQNIYRDAIKQGAWTGIILLVAFLIVVLIWSLL